MEVRSERNIAAQQNMILKFSVKDLLKYRDVAEWGLRVYQRV